MPGSPAKDDELSLALQRVVQGAAQGGDLLVAADEGEVIEPRQGA